MTLHLNACPLTDAAAADLAKLTTVKFLFVEDTPLTDAAIPELGKMASLKYIFLNGTKITPAGEEALQKLLPRVTLMPRSGLWQY